MVKDDNRLTGRLKRYASVSWNIGGLMTQLAGARYLNFDSNPSPEQVRKVLGNLKGPLVKIFQLLATIPDALPQEYANELMHLQSNAPRMGWGFVRRRMKGELGPDWQSKFKSFEQEAAAAASLGQVHKATTLDGKEVACKLQYPDMESAVEADITQFRLALKAASQFSKALKTEDIVAEVRERLLEELDYEREAKHIKLYEHIFRDDDLVTMPAVLPELSTNRLLTMEWVGGDRLLDLEGASEDVRNHVAKNLFKAWYLPLYQFGVIHGDPHLGNYLFPKDGSVALLDFGCVRIFPSTFVEGSINLYRALQAQDDAMCVHAYEQLGFRNISKELLQVLNIWADYLYNPLLDDRVRPIEETYSSKKGQAMASSVYEKLNQLGGVKPPKEFVFMDRAAIGLGAVFMRLRAHLNWHQMFEELIENFSPSSLEEKQQEALKIADLI